MFYENVFDSTILEAMHKMTLAIKDTSNKNIFVFWGLHFSTLSTAQDKKDSRHRVFRELVRSLFSWIGHVKETTSKEVKKNSIQVVKEIHGEIVNHFKAEDMVKLETEVERKMAGMYVDGITNTEEAPVEIPMETQATIDHPVKYQKSA
jgi:ribosomal protein L31E